MPSVRLRLVGALIFLVVLGVTHTTAATWISGAVVPGATLQTGRLDVKLDGVDAIDDAALDTAGLRPSLTKATDFTVSNAGSVPLDYSPVLSGTNGDGQSLFANLSKKVVVGSTTDGTTCTGQATTGMRTLAPGGSEKLCVQLGLPTDAGAALFGSATTVTVSVASNVRGAWTDDATAAGNRLAALDPRGAAPAVSCGSSAKLQWLPVAGATGYVVHSSLLGDLALLDPGVTSLDLTLALGVITVRARFGSPTWESPPSRQASLLGVLCNLL